MPELDDSQLDELIRRRFASALDAKVGRTEAAFRRQLAARSEQTRAIAPQVSPSRFKLRFGGRFFAVVGTALAASIAGLGVAPNLFRNPPAIQTPIDQPVRPTQQVAANPVPASPTPPMVHYVQNRTWDDGTVIVGQESPAPARRIVRERLERVRYFDKEQRAWIEITVPRRDVQFMEVDPY